jgi:exoribonuclease-2
MIFNQNLEKIMNLVAGCVVEFSAKGSQPGFAAVLSSAGGNVRLLLPNGKETTVHEKKILHATSRPVLSVADREACRTAIHEIDQRRRDLVQTIDLAEVHELLAEESKGFSLEDIAGYLFAPEDEDSAAALLRALSEDKLYFRQKSDLYTPMSADEIRQIRLQLEKKQAQEEEENPIVEALNLLSKKQLFPEELRQKLYDLKMFVACGEEAQINKRLMSALSRSALLNQRKLMSALVNAGVMSPDENLLLIKYRVPTDFSDELQSLAKNLAENNDLAAKATRREDFRHLITWAIDTPGSKDRDDAFSFEVADDGQVLLYVHVADPAEFILPGSELDHEAACRGSSIYMPDSRIHMLPQQISEEFLSLDQGRDRFALTFILSFDAELNLAGLEIKESLISLDQATEYDQADAMLGSNPWLDQAHAFAEKLKKRRAANGAVMFPRQPELEIKVVDGEILVSQRSREDLAAGMIAEFMIWANHAAAEWCRRNSVPCLYRIQEMDEVTLEFGESFDPVAFFAALKSFRKTVVSANAGRHSSLGLDSYTQITSPLRRYADLLLHRQIKATLKGEALPYSQAELNQTMLIADEAISRADEIMRDRERYFLYKHLKMRQKNEALIFDGVVVDQSMNDVTFYCDYICAFRHCRKPAFEVAVGQKVKVKVNQIDLFDGIIRFDLAEA